MSRDHVGDSGTVGNAGASAAATRVDVPSVDGVGKVVGACFCGGVSGNAPGAPTELGSGVLCQCSSVRVARACPALSRRLVTTASSRLSSGDWALEGALDGGLLDGVLSGGKVTVRLFV